MVHQTETYKGKTAILYEDMYMTPTPISKASNVVVDVWDDKSSTPNEALMSRWTLTPDQLGQFYVKLIGDKEHRSVMDGKTHRNTLEIWPKWF